MTTFENEIKHKDQTVYEKNSVQLKKNSSILCELRNMLKASLIS